MMQTRIGINKRHWSAVVAGASRRGISVRILAAVLATCLTMGTVPLSLQSVQAGESETLITGKVTGIVPNGIQIDKRNYQLDPEVKVETSEGAAFDINKLPEGAIVKYHLEEGKVDRIVLVLLQ